MLRREIRQISDIEFTEAKPEYPVTKYGRRISVRYNDFNAHPNSIHIDMRLGEKVLKRAENREVMHVYDTLDKFRMPSMRIEEIMAEKIRAITYSGQPRHLYDTWFLFRKKVPLVPALVTKKTKSYEEKFDIEKFKMNVKGMERTWLTDLQPLLPTVPSFQAVSRSIITKISKIMK
jgi:predicted nucleotidyltransferase component of viral defense system